MHHRSPIQIRVPVLWLCALIILVLPTHSYADPLVTTGGCKIWVHGGRGEGKKVTWTGECDAAGYATGHGKLYSKDGVIFEGEMKSGYGGDEAAFLEPKVPKKRPVKRDVPKPADDACTKTALVNGKKFCVE